MSLIKRLICWFAGHEWETVQTYTVDVSPVGYGTLRCRKCARCKEEQTTFECTASIGSTKSQQESITPLKPSSSRDLLNVYSTEKSATDVPENTEKQQSKTTKRTSKKVSDTTSCNQS